MTTIIVFASSLLLVLVLFVAKAVELRFNKKNYISDFLNKFDSKSEMFITNLKFRSLQFIQTIRYILVVKFRIFIEALFKELKMKALNEYIKIQDEIMGKRAIAANGSASFYLKKIAENKENIEKGKIEDSLPE